MERGIAQQLSGLTKHADLTERIIAACFEVHNVLGPGLEERFYRDALLYELQLRGISAQTEQEFPVQYKGRFLGLHRVDLIVEDKIVLELKAVEGMLLPVHVAQTVSEREVSKLPVALLINFGNIRVEVRRLEQRERKQAL